ncbi:hypothetical protein R1sor_025117 [Riccia sorocarpa]|uniref:SWIM-type domain-containing protein n=1 Tax=Riccia sorocarpa TaxID=122646 RepID=A0ABD3GDD2_9MARC
METCATLSDSSFNDIQLVPCGSDGSTTVTAAFCSVRWRLDEKSIYINERKEILDRVATLLLSQFEPGTWKLRSGTSYVVLGNPQTLPSVTLRDSSVKKSTLDDGASRTASKATWEGVQPDASLVSGFEACLRIQGSSELSSLDLLSFEHRRVNLLPDSYDGNIIFELPPSTRDELAKKGGSLSGMDRGNDCWLWTMCVTTTAQIGGKVSSYSVNKIHYVGSLKCVNDSCPFFLAEGEANRRDWPDKVHRDKPYEEGSPVPMKSHVCGQCDALPTCDAACTALMYYVIPKPKLDIEEVLHIWTVIATRRGTDSGNYNTVISVDISTQVNVDDFVINSAHSPEVGAPGDIFYTADDDIQTNHTESYQAASPEFPTPVATHPPNGPGPAEGSATPEVISEDDSDVVILRVTPRARPPTRASPMRTVAEGIPRRRQQGEGTQSVSQHGIPVREQEVNRRFWHLSRINPSGNPACNAAMTGRGAPRSLCKTKIKISGHTVCGVPTVAPSFVGYSRFNGVERPHQFWFCPNSTCIGGRGSQACKFQMPRSPEVMPVMTGTNLSQAEVDFLTGNGIILVHRIRVEAAPMRDFPTVTEIRINVDAYPQKIGSVAPDFVYNQRGSKGCRRKSVPSNDCQTRLQSARTTTMMLSGEWTVTEGNGYGKVFRISTHLDEDIRNYLVQLCCFPACSCGDFFERESRLRTFFPCKHLYWVYMNILGLRPGSSIMHQPVFSRLELDILLSMQTMTPQQRENVRFQS